MNKFLTAFVLCIGVMGLGRSAQAASTDTYKCTDSDGGKNNFSARTKGTVTVEVTGRGASQAAAPKTVTDVCKNVRVLKEYYCAKATSSAISMVEISCGYRMKCNDGACVDRN